MKHIVFTVLLAISSFSAVAQVTVSDPWVRGTVPQQKATGAFMQLQATQDARLVAVSSPVAGVVELHEMAMDGNVMKMRALPKGLALPAGQPVALKPGGYHIMLMELKRPLQDGETVPLTLLLEGKDKKPSRIEVKAVVKPLGAAAERTEPHHSHGH